MGFWDPTDEQTYRIRLAYDPTISSFFVCVFIRILQLMSGGMIDKWTTDALHKATIRHSIKLDGAADDYGDSASLPNDNVQRALNMDDLQGAFIILGVGNLAAAALLAAEIIFSRGRLAKFMKHKKNSFHENEEDGQKESLSFHNILPC
jgi:hypothetical protein